VSPVPSNTPWTATTKRHGESTKDRGDAISLSIAAASVLAKVHRDRLLVELDREFPGYGLAQNKGYPCPAHKAALERLGPTPLHRRSFLPVAQAALQFPQS